MWNCCFLSPASCKSQSNCKALKALKSFRATRRKQKLNIFVLIFFNGVEAWKVVQTIFSEA